MSPPICVGYIRLRHWLNYRRGSVCLIGTVPQIWSTVQSRCDRRIRRLRSGSRRLRSRCDRNPNPASDPGEAFPGSLQYLQIVNNRMGSKPCNYDFSSTHKVTVEVLTKSQARSLLHKGRFEPFNPHPRPNDPTGPFRDEVGVGKTARPWKMGGNRSAIPRASATANFAQECCCNYYERSCEATAEGTSGNRSRSDGSHIENDGGDPWDF